MTVAEFAQKTRTSPQTIRDAIKAGRLTAVKSGKAWNIPDYAKGYRELFGTDAISPPSLSVEPGEPQGDVAIVYRDESYQQSAAEEKFWQARAAELKYRTQSGGLIEKNLAIELYAQEISRCRTKLLALPARMKQRIKLTDEQLALVDSLVREALEALTDGSGIGGDHGAED